MVFRGFRWPIHRWPWYPLCKWGGHGATPSSGCATPMGKNRLRCCCMYIGKAVKTRLRCCFMYLEKKNCEEWHTLPLVHMIKLCEIWTKYMHHNHTRQTTNCAHPVVSWCMHSMHTRSTVYIYIYINSTMIPTAIVCYWDILRLF